MIRWLVVAGMQITDVLSMVFGAHMGFVVRFGDDPMDQQKLAAVGLAVLITLLAFPALRATGLSALEDPWRGLKRASRAFGAVFVILAMVAFGLQLAEEFSRLWVGIWIGAAYFSLVCTRIWWSGFLKHGLDAGFLRERVALIHGVGTRHVDAVARQLEQSGFDVVSFVCIESPCGHHRERVHAPVALERTRACQSFLSDFVHRFGSDPVDRAILLPDPGDDRPLPQIASPLRMVPLDVDVLPAGFDPVLVWRPPRLAGGLPVVNLMTRPLSDFDVLVKRSEDLALGTLFLILAAPLMLLIAGLIKLDSPGPILFAQSRAGFNNRPFKIYKFRSMYVHDDSQVRQATRGDRRVTRVGSILRRTSLDELPQLFNVVLGSMSLVGPRPHALAHDREYGALIDSYIARHRMKPGLTGWAQVNGWRGETETLEKMQKRIEHDLYYVDHWSFFLDIKILLLTVRVLYHNNAY
jgi:putative colanic acid biosynthesis UDP-glucose lipid carrier transferase